MHYGWKIVAWLTTVHSSFTLLNCLARELCLFLQKSNNQFPHAYVGS